MEIVLLGIIMIVLLFLICLIVDISESFFHLMETIETQHYSIHRIESYCLTHLKYSFSKCAASVEYIGIVDDDDDVYGDKYVVYFHPTRFSKIKIPIVYYYFYAEKSYKNRKEFILWQDNEESLELSYLDKLVKRITMDIIQNRLKKKSPVLTKSISL
jgi:hypothetical protein